MIFRIFVYLFFLFLGSCSFPELKIDEKNLIRFEKAFENFSKNKFFFVDVKTKRDPVDHAAITSAIIEEFDYAAMPIVELGQEFFFQVFTELEKSYGKIPVSKEDTYLYLK